MRNTTSPFKTFLYRLSNLVFVLLCGFFITLLFYFAFLFLQNHADLAALENAMKTAYTTANQIRVLQTLQSFLIFIFPPLLLCRMFSVEYKHFLSLRRPSWKHALLAMASIVAMMPALNAMVAWNADLHLPDALQSVEQSLRASEDAAASITDKLMAGTSWMDLLLNLLVVAVLAGIGEELFFRGLLLRMLTDTFRSKGGTGLKPWAMHVSIWIVAIVFSAIHMQFFGFFPRVLLGAWFGYLLWWSKSIWVPMLAHFTNNALSTLTVFGQNKGLLSSNPDRWGLDETWWLSVLSLLLTATIVLYFKKTSRR